MALIYAETGMGCCIKNYPNLEKAASGILREVGTQNGVSKVRWATANDVSWVRMMGGTIPEGKIHEAT
jgi:hypothetical protein